MTSDLVDRIYEAAALPELWPGLLHDLAGAYGFVGAGLFSMNPQFQRGVASPAIEDLLRRFLTEGWAAKNSRAPRAAVVNPAGFTRDQDLLSDEEIATDPLYAEFLRPNGLGWGAGSVMDAPNGDRVVVTFERAYAQGPTPVEVLPRLDALRPHLARAALFSGRLDLERSQAQVSALAAVGLPAAVLTARGEALAANEEFEQLAPQIEIGARDLVTLSDHPSRRLFETCLAGDPAAGAAGRSIPVAAAETRPGAVLHLLPVRRAARDVFARSAWLAVATPLGQRLAPSVSILSGLFDLTPAEARVARKLIEGRSVAELAAEDRLSESTVRNQLRAVFAKTGATRQSELILLCAGAAEFPDPRRMSGEGRGLPG